MQIESMRIKIRKWWVSLFDMMTKRSAIELNRLAAADLC